MVAGFQDDVDLEDKPPSRPLLPPGPGSRENTLSNEEAAGPPKATALAPQKCSEPETTQYVGLPRGAAPGERKDRLLTASLSRRPPTKAPRPHKRAEPSRGPSGKDELAASSESDPEGPIAAQMLSFVMDDPDFESDSETLRRAVRASGEGRGHLGTERQGAQLPHAGQQHRDARAQAWLPVTGTEGRGCSILAATLRHCCPFPWVRCGPSRSLVTCPGKGRA